MAQRSVRAQVGVSLYRQVESVFRARIAEAVLRPGDRLPGEEAIRAEFGVSRATVRQALDALERDRLIERHAGRGTFVAAAAGSPRTRDVRRPVAFADLVALVRATGSVIRHGIAPAPAAATYALGLSPDAQVPFLIHVLSAGRRCRVAAKHYFAPSFGVPLRALAKAADLGAATAKHLGGEPVAADFRVESVLAEPRFALMLAVPLGAALLSVWWTGSLGARPVSRTQMLLPGNALGIECGG